ncbi:MAG: hypothetical protein RLP12_13700, partial [Ekhidna sp.]
ILFIQCSSKQSHTALTGFLMSAEYQNWIELEQNNSLRKLVKPVDSSYYMKMEKALSLIDKIKMKLIINANQSFSEEDFTQFALGPNKTYYDIENPNFDKNLDFLIENFPSLKNDLNVPIGIIRENSKDPQNIMLLMSPCEDPIFPNEKECSEENFF